MKKIAFAMLLIAVSAVAQTAPAPVPQGAAPVPQGAAPVPVAPRKKRSRPGGI